MKSIFIDENIKISEGNMADNLLKKENDKEFISKNSGINKVTKNRWIKAQKCERKHWMANGLKSFDDRNYYHAKNFRNYSDLGNKIFKNALEIGCGPYTNLRIIGSFCKIYNCSLVDPLIDDYLNHPFCSYDRNYLYIDNMSFFSKIIRIISSSLNKKINKTSSNKIKIKEIYNLPVEKLNIDYKFDLVIMINVLEHCYDINKIFENILKFTSKNAYFIFEDKLYEHKKVVKETNTLYDAAHPLKIDKCKINSFLKNNFKTIYKHIQQNSSILEKNKFIWDDIYFIGKKNNE